MHPRGCVLFALRMRTAAKVEWLLLDTEFSEYCLQLSGLVFSNELKPLGPCWLPDSSLILGRTSA